MTDTATPHQAATLKLTKGTNWNDTVYHVELDGVKVGWVAKQDKWSTEPGTWRFYAHLKDSIKADLVASHAKTRRDALMEGVSHIEIYRSGWVVVSNPDDVLKVEEKVIEPARLRALWNQLLNEKYPEAAQAVVKDS